MYSDKQKENISNNLKALMKTYNYKQVDVADAIGVRENTFSGYINMTSLPSRENLKKLAKFFKVSEIELLNKDLTLLNKPIYNHISNIIRNLDILFPIVEIKQVKDDNYFKEAKDLHYKLFQLNDHSIELVDVLSLYNKSIDKYNNLDSRANSLILFLFAICGLKNENDLDEFLEIYDPKDSHELEIIIKDSFLQCFDFDLDVFDYNKDNDTLVHNIEVIINNSIEELKKYDEYKDFLEYYLMLKYYMGFGNVNLDQETNRLIGFEMLSNLMLLDNKYANIVVEKITDMMDFE